MTGFLVLVGLAVHVGEAMPLAWVVDYQMQDPNAVYLTEDQTTTFAYKVMMTARQQPDVVLVGSSRALNFRAGFVKAPFTFYNAGANGWRLHEIAAYLHTLTPENKPDLLIMSVDQFWFNTDWVEWNPPPSIATGEISADYILHSTRHTIQELLQRQLTFDQIFNPFDPRNEGRKFGLQAVERGRGYRVDGSIQPRYPEKSDLLRRVWG